MKYLKILFLPSIIYVIIILILAVSINPAYHWLLIPTPLIFIISIIITIIDAINDKYNHSNPNTNDSTNNNISK